MNSYAGIEFYGVWNRTICVYDQCKLYDMIELIDMFMLIVQSTVAEM